MTEPAGSPAPDPAEAAIAGLGLGARKLLGRAWTRPASKPLVLTAGLAADFGELEAAGLAIRDGDLEGRDCIGLTLAGRDAAAALRRMGERQPPPPARKPTLAVLRAEVAAPEPKAEASHEPASEPKPRAGGGGRPARPERATGEIYPGCPVQALGVHGKMFFYLDILGQLQGLDNHTKDRMRGLFGGRIDLLMAQWPSWSKGEEPKVIGWKQEDAAAAMQRACSERGVWRAFERERGVGAWTDPEGGLVLHCGDAVLYRGEWRAPGLIEGYVYPAGVPAPRPGAPGAVGEAAHELLDLLATWSWRPLGDAGGGGMRRSLEPHLLLGWLGAAIFGGALDWRPLMWITGDASTGKSTLHKVIRAVLGGDGAVLQSTDATEAGIRQLVLQTTLPVALDELEAEVDNRRALAVVKLARQAGSAGQILRGGSDHSGQTFRARSAFLFSSILIPPLLDQDISRIALLELGPLDRDGPALKLDTPRLLALGRALRAQIAAQWHRLAPTQARYAEALAKVGHNARGCDQFGTLLTMADLALHDDIPAPERAEAWALQLAAAAISEHTDSASDWQRMLNHLMGQYVDAAWRGGERFTVGQWVMAAAKLVDDPDPIKAPNVLAAFGMRVSGSGPAARLAVANVNPNLAQLFVGTHWHAAGGQKGVWAQAVKRIPGSTSTGVTRFNGVASRAFEFSLSAVPNFFDPQDAGPEGRASVSAPAQGVAGPTYSPEDFA